MDLTELEAKVERLKEKRLLLTHALGRNEFDEVVGAISKVVREHNLDTTPTILKDLFGYILEINCHTGI